METLDEEIEVGTQLDGDAINVPDEETSNSFEDEHAHPKAKADDVAATDEEDKEQYSKKVQKRIDKLTAKNYQAESELQAERQRRLEIEAELNEYRNKTADAELQLLKAEKVRLIDSGNLEEAEEVDEKLHDLRTKKALREEQQRQVKQQPQQAEQKGPPEAQQAWLEQNDWFYNPAKQAQRKKADEVYLKLVDEGFDPNDEDTYVELDRRLKGEAAPRKQQERPPAGIGPDRGNAGAETKSVKFSDIDAAKMRRWGLNPNDATQRAEYLKNKGVVAA